MFQTKHTFNKRNLEHPKHFGNVKIYETIEHNEVSFLINNYAQLSIKKQINLPGEVSQALVP